MFFLFVGGANRSFVFFIAFPAIILQIEKLTIDTLKMLLSTIIRFAQSFSYRMFPVFPQLQVVAPVWQRTPFALTNGGDSSEKKDLVSWIQDNFLQFAVPKKRVGFQRVVYCVVFNSQEKTTESHEKLGAENEHRRLPQMWQVQAASSLVQ